MLTFNLASALVYNRQKKILILKRSNKNKYFKGYWQLPEGKIENKEFSKNAVLRELREELGFIPNSLKRLKSVSNSLYIKDRKVRSNRTVYLVRYNGNIHLSRDHDKYRWVLPANVGKNRRLVPGTKEVIDLL